MGKKLVDPNKLCMGCMKILDRPDLPCPSCGFSKELYVQPDNSMPLYEIIKGKYLIGRVIGVGGFGITYIGWDFYQSKRVCIKEYFPRGVAARTMTQSVSQYGTYSIDVYTQNTAQAKHTYMHGLEAYIHEAQMLSQFYFMPGIVSVRDFFYGNHTAYIVMEFIEGTNLKQLAKQSGGVLECDFLCNLLRDVMCALAAVHKVGIVHRDISPDNIMVNKEWQAKVIDFGAAKEYQAARDETILLKHGYAPVEQYDRNGHQGPWTDVYSLCATLYYLLCGQKPQRAYERVGEDKLLPLSSLGVHIDAAREAAIMHGLAIRPEERTQSMPELYRELFGTAMPGYEQQIEHADSARFDQRRREDVAMEYLQQQKKSQNEGMQDEKQM